MTPDEYQQASYDLEVQKLALERERQAKEQQLEATKFAFTQRIEKEKLRVEVEKARWAKIAVWFTPASIFVSVGIALVTVLSSQRAQRDAAKAEFQLKAAEIVLQSDDPEVNWNKACRIQDLFEGDYRLPTNWAEHFNDWKKYAVEDDNLKREVAKLLIENPPNGQTIRTIAREADVRQERALPEWNRCNQRLTETRVSNITHYGIGHFQRRNLARDTFLAVTHVPHPFAA